MPLPDPLHYATYFDLHYLTRGLTLYHSLVQHSPPFHLWVLCLDETTEAVLRELALPNVGLLSLIDLEAADPALLEAKSDRTALEYYWTLTPAWLLHLLDQHPEIDLLTYLDADLFFFGDPSPLYEELGGGSMLALPTRYAPNVTVSGSSRFNVGFNAFRHSSEALACLRRWREQCLEWCFDRSEPGRLGDQSYLDDWPEHYAGFVASVNPGAGLGPWNIGSPRLSNPAGRLLTDGVPAIFFHFSRWRIISPWLHEPGMWARRVAVTPVMKHALCVPYARALRQAQRQVRTVSADFPSVDTQPRSRWHASLRQTLLHRTFLIVTDSFAL